MTRLLSCRYNMDTNRVEARFEDELDWLLYNKPLEYAQLVLGGGMEHYLSLGCDHSRLED